MLSSRSVRASENPGGSARELGIVVVAIATVAVAVVVVVAPNPTADVAAASDMGPMGGSRGGGVGDGGGPWLPDLVPPCVQSKCVGILTLCFVLSCGYFDCDRQY